LGSTVEAVRAVRDTLVVVLCGQDERLRARLRIMDDVLPIDWTSDVVDYLCAADVVVDNAGGLTCWEAQCCGTPVVLFRPLVGHGRVNVATLDELGLATWAHDRAELARLLTRPAELSAALPRSGPAEEVLFTLADSVD
jgi:UDP-N-acetylglucosamine:LPS N-acetylglucosamine transferase